MRSPPESTPMRLENIVGGKKETPEKAAQLCLCGTRRHVTKVVEDARFRIQFLVLVLGEVVRFNVVPQSVLASGQGLGLGQQFDQCGLSGSVDSDQGDPVATLDQEADVAKYFFLAVRF